MIAQRVELVLASYYGIHKSKNQIILAIGFEQKVSFYLIQCLSLLGYLIMKRTPDKLFSLPGVPTLTSWSSYRDGAGTEVGGSGCGGCWRRGCRWMGDRGAVASGRGSVRISPKALGGYVDSAFSGAERLVCLVTRPGDAATAATVLVLCNGRTCCCAEAL